MGSGVCFHVAQSEDVAMNNQTDVLFPSPDAGRPAVDRRADTLNSEPEREPDVPLELLAAVQAGERTWPRVFPGL